MGFLLNKTSSKMKIAVGILIVGILASGTVPSDEVLDSTIEVSDEYDYSEVFVLPPYNTPNFFGMQAKPPIHPAGHTYDNGNEHFPDPHVSNGWGWPAKIKPDKVKVTKNKETHIKSKKDKKDKHKWSMIRPMGWDMLTQLMHPEGWGMPPPKKMKKLGWGMPPPKKTKKMGWGTTTPAPATMGWGMPPPTKGWGMPPPTKGWGMPPPTKGWGMPPASMGWGWKQNKKKEKRIIMQLNDLKTQKVALKKKLKKIQMKNKMTPAPTKQSLLTKLKSSLHALLPTATGWKRMDAITTELPTESVKTS